MTVPTIRGVADRMLSAAVAGELRRRGVELGMAPRFLGRPIVSMAERSSIRIGDRFLAISRSRSTALGVAHPLVVRTLHPGASIEVGDDVGISGGSICAASRVSVGSGCLFGADSIVVDTDFHPVRHPDRRYAALPAPAEEDAITIGRNVFLGTGVIVLRGSRIGDDAVIGAGAVVRGIVKPASVVVGNPLRTQAFDQVPAGS